MKENPISEELVMVLYKTGHSIEHIAKELRTNTVVVRKIIYPKKEE
tara:strand:+ start:339 stop:476 length:138 start_codon:yes stop_codon:yes gene_type:complete